MPRWGRRSQPDRPAPASGKKLVLHVGCGRRGEGRLPPRFQGDDWHEVRLDIDPRVEPDIVASIVDMSEVKSESVDAVWSAHNLEHVYAHEVPVVLRGFFRVLRPGGEVLITLPDLQGVAELIVADKLEGIGASRHWPTVAPLDMVYGHRSAIQQGREGMAHRTGFTQRSLTDRLRQAGFVEVDVQRDETLVLWATARKPKL